MSRAREAVRLEVASSTRQYLHLGLHQWLILAGSVAAVKMEEVYFPDQTFSRAQMAAINGFYAGLPHTRVPLADWDYYVASSAMRALRPLLGRQPEEPASTTQPEDQNNAR